MLSDDEEDRLLQRAVDKGWLSASELRGEAKKESAAAPPARFGARLDALLRAGMLSEQAISQLLQEEPSATPRAEVPESLAIDRVPTMRAAATSARAAPPTAGRFVSPVPGWERYDLLSLLGEGGMGTVYKARDLRLNRLVAVKFIRVEHTGAVSRFLQEARAQARIDHEHVCKVYEVGEVEGRPYIAMEFVSGLPLHKVMGRLRLEEKLCLVRDAAEALHAAHRLGIVHRDIKPSNILTQRLEDGTWRPVVMDFGLAHDSEAEQQLTRTGMVMGTPVYMSPEQARGDTRNLDRRTDVYALGVTLFELLTERLPFDGPSQAAVLLQTLTQEPPLLRFIQPGLPVDLETIVMKCLQKEPAQRYESARALAEDLRRYLNGDPILGKRTSLFYRLRRKAQKHQAAVTVAGLALVGLGGLGAYGLQARLAVRHEKAQAAARAQLSQELGQNIKEMEWFVRSVEQLPLHQVSYAQTLLYTRIKKLGALHHELGEAGEGLVQYALGQGYLALKDFDKAYTHLAAAQRKGNDTPELRWALGRVLGEQYKKKLEDALRNGDVSFVKAQKQELSAAYLQPALVLLRGSQGVEFGSPHLLAGLIALYSQKYAEALQEADETVRQAPWLYEARQLAGDVYFAQAIDQLNQTDYDPAQKSFARAIEKYKEAAEIGRSDAQLYESIAESYLQWGDIATNLQRRLTEGPLFDQANLYCQKAIAIAPERPHCYSKSARAYAGLLGVNRLRGVSFTDYFNQLLTVAQLGLRRNPDDAYLYDSLGNAYHAMATTDGQEAAVSLKYYDLAIENLRRALSKQPRFPISMTNLGYAHLDKALLLFDSTGNLPQEEFDQALHHLKAAAVIDPQYGPAWIDLLMTYHYLIKYSTLTGRDPAAWVGEMMGQYQSFRAKNLKLEGAFFAVVASQHQYINYLLLKPDLAALAGAHEQERAVVAQAESPGAPGGDQLPLVQMYGAADEARILVANRQDPTPALQAARLAMAGSLQELPYQAERHRLASTLALLTADLAAQRGQPVLVPLQEAVTQARRAIAALPEAEYHEQLARALLRLAATQVPHPSAALLAEGLKSTAEGIKRAPGLAETYALRGRFYLLQAQATASDRERLALAALSAFTQAVNKNPLLARAYESYIAQTNALIALPSPKTSG